MKYSIEEKTLTDMAMAIRGNLQGNPGELRLETTLTLTHENQTYDWDISAIAPGSSKYRFTVKDVQFTLSDPDAYSNLTLTFEPTAYTTGWGNEGRIFQYGAVEFPFTATMKNVEKSKPLHFSLLYSKGSGDSVTFTFILEAIDENENSFDYTPQEMIDTINNMLPGPSPEELVVTGNCLYRFSNNGWNWFINKYGEKITTKDITGINYIFGNSTNIRYVPFEINCKSGLSQSGQSVFYNSGLFEIPMINNFRPSELKDFFSGCKYITYIPDGFGENWGWSAMDGATSEYYAYQDALFQGCSRLRRLPMLLLQHGNPKINYGNGIYKNMATDCYCLDEIIDLPNPHFNGTYNQASTYSNIFYNTVWNTYRLKDFTFAEMAPVRWANQVLNMGACGWAVTRSRVADLTEDTASRPGIITKDKEVTDDASYQALKNDPDWWSANMAYSRYNHDSAVRTINSLPSAIEYQTANNQGANKIQFTGAAGSATDGGAINTLTEEEIAVAVAKGWTVILV